MTEDDEQKAVLEAFNNMFFTRGGLIGDIVPLNSRSFRERKS